MTIHQATKQAQNQLSKNDDARFDALCLAEHAFGLDQTQLRLQADRQIDPTRYFEYIARRAAGEPLQYILGQWEFYGLPFAVGPGALIPRPETEMLVDLAINSPFSLLPSPFTVVDLCAGTGCIGLSVAHHCPNAQVHLIELSEEAMPYLIENASKYPNAQVHHADIFNCQLSIVNCQLILSNPPYVKSSEIGRLSREVRYEPRMALDGGADGLDFYRGTARTWLPRLSAGGMLAVECGEGQAAEIATMFAPYETEILRDFNGIQRIVIARA